MLKKPRTKLELKEQKKKELGEAIEYMRQVELPELQGGGRKFIHDTRKEEKRQEKEKDEQIANFLESRVNQQKGYRRRIADYAEKESYASLDNNEKWEYHCIPTSGERIAIYGKAYRTQEGLIHVLKSPKGAVYIRALGVTYDPEMDVANVHTMMVQAQNTIDAEKGLVIGDNKDTAATYKKKKSGIWAPN